MIEWFTLTKLFPLSLIVLDLAASLTYAWFLDWRMCAYWFFAAALTLTITL